MDSPSRWRISPEVQDPVFEAHLLPCLLTLFTGTDGEWQRLADGIQHYNIAGQQLNSTCRQQVWWVRRSSDKGEASRTCKLVVKGETMLCRPPLAGATFKQGHQLDGLSEALAAAACCDAPKNSCGWVHYSSSPSGVCRLLH